MELGVAYTNVMNPIQIADPLAAGNMPTADSLHSAYSRRRLSVFPRIPIGYENVILQPQYELAENGKRFLIFHQSFPTVPGGVVDNHILCFGTKTFFKKMCQAKVVHTDGTSKVCPTPYQQLFTISSFHHDDDEGYADSLDNRLLPRLYCLLSGKSQQIYETLFQLIIDKAAHWNVDISWLRSMSDFEQSIFNALTVKFPDLVKRGCHFHFCQALFRRIQRNMKVSYEFFLIFIYLISNNTNLL